MSCWTLEIPDWTPTHPGGQRASCSSRCPSAWRSTAGGREASAWSRRPQKFPSARTTSGSRGKVKRGGRGACRFTGLRLCEDTYRKVDKTRVVQIIMLQGCERGSGVYDSVTGKERHQNKEKQGQKRYKDFSEGQWWGRRRQWEGEHGVRKERVMKQQEKGREEKGWGLDSPSPPVPSQWGHNTHTHTHTYCLNTLINATLLS